MAEDTAYYERVYGIVRSVPAGRVTTYGAIAFLLDTPRRARMVGRAMARLAPGHRVPWHRVVNSAGRLAPGCEEEQRRLLEKERVPFRRDGTVDLEQVLFDPWE